jgi:lambda family phage portal protein
VPTSTVAINSLIRSYGRTVLARSRYLARNNPADAVGQGLLRRGAGRRRHQAVVAGHRCRHPRRIMQAWLEWTDESDADGLTDFYGQQAIVAGEMFEAGECFVRLRPRRIRDGLSVPLQLQLLPAEMLDLADNRDLGFGRRVEMGIEFDAIGNASPIISGASIPAPTSFGTGQKTTVPADQVLHMFKPLESGQIRGIPHTLSAIIRAAIMDAYDDAELERKRTAALFGAFITLAAPEEDPLAEAAAAGQGRRRRRRHRARARRHR